ncbi:hypothetical protein COT94_01950 [Candidatus Falkowbacteria bacterium CG10_big_fil_rev_8_21_14_0_10_37_14]|uniref:Uncharacterized protein n=1 Tax=Candidatus Falkowbacteria bacterium CG10_big_fil_rev_8_21_14_0_10_37_14 TaxID=1974561 RepID=A0A2M6WT82_9BACT|nr:hypothetical protein [Candidatus Falkowbacteria bacterium]PIT96007.1 MAG: hypothetical protein COT94_01950 [Candidatus Falkowbacteria bacterium CG10_big_fil_rev_8_21_14_0_10_37_14]
MPYFNTKDVNLAIKFLDYINQALFNLKGYTGAKFTSRIEPVYIDKHGKYKVELNNGQAINTKIEPKNGTMFTEDEVEQLLNQA